MALSKKRSILKKALKGPMSMAPNMSRYPKVNPDDVGDDQMKEMIKQKFNSRDDAEFDDYAQSVLNDLKRRRKIYQKTGIKLPEWQKSTEI